VSHEKFPETSELALPYFLQGVKNCANFAPIFDTTRIPKHSGFKTKLYIKNLENAEDASMIALNIGQESSPISPQFLQGVKKQFCPILPF